MLNLSLLIMYCCAEANNSPSSTTGLTVAQQLSDLWKRFCYPSPPTPVKGYSALHTKISIFDYTDDWWWHFLFIYFLPAEDLLLELHWLKYRSAPWVWSWKYLVMFLSLSSLFVLWCVSCSSAGWLSYTASWSSPVWQGVSRVCFPQLSGNI